MDKFELWQLPSLHFGPRWRVSERPGLRTGKSSCRGRGRRIIECGWKGSALFPGICQGSFLYCTEGTSNPKIIYTGHFDRIEEKRLLTMTRVDQPFSVKQLGFSLMLFSNFCFHWTLCAKTQWTEAISRKEPIVRAALELLGHPPGQQGPSPGSEEAVTSPTCPPPRRLRDSPHGARKRKLRGLRGRLIGSIHSTEQGIILYWKCRENRGRWTCCNFTILFLILLKESSSWQ